jgi:ABC-2 type transport system ATP-binding protein
MSDIVIEAQGLTKRYGSIAAVDNISFTVTRGEIFGVLGPNGAGKTTTILMLLGLTEVTDGSISVLGLNPAREPLQVKRKVGYLPDTVGFYDHMTALDNLRYTAALIGIEPGVRDQRIIDALDRVGLGDVVAAFRLDLDGITAAQHLPAKLPDRAHQRDAAAVE